MLERGVYAHPFIEDANAFVALTAPFERTQRKYGPRGYRYLLLEAGHVAQNLCLAAGRRGLATLCIGGFVDSILNAELGLDPRVAGVLYGVGVGVSAEDRVDG
jgi:SagB-type dehydrogenase family enzyme